MSQPHWEPALTGISCLMPFYGRDDPEHFKLAVGSVLSQTRWPDELVLVQDGPVPESLTEVVAAIDPRLPVRRVVLDENRGLGVALALGVEACRYDLIARMDADDLSRPTRLERQEAVMRTDPELAILGTAIEEFSHRPGDLMRTRRLACSDEPIRRLSRIRNPFNHMTVMLRRSAILAAGNYRPTPAFEDYDLWLRVLKQPTHVGNLDDVLVDARVGNGMLSRRRGLSYVRAELSFLRRAHAEGLLSMADACRSAAIRLPFRLIPTAALEWAYRRVLRRP